MQDKMQDNPCPKSRIMVQVCGHEWEKCKKQKNEVVIFRVQLYKQGEPEMKKETVSNDSLKEKIEEILTPYRISS